MEYLNLKEKTEQQSEDLKSFTLASEACIDFFYDLSVNLEKENEQIQNTLESLATVIEIYKGFVREQCLVDECMDYFEERIDELEKFNH